VKILEHKGIGRPSTYASIISTIVEREYVELLKKQIHPTELGRVVNKLLIANFPGIFEVEFTANMESGLDKVENGSVKWLDLLREFYGSFSEELKAAEKKFSAELVVDIPCPSCGKLLTIKYGKMGPFVACTGYPECTFTSDFKRDESGKIELVVKASAVSTGLKCEKCGSELVIKKSRFGEMLACSAYPDCKNIKSFVRLPDGNLKVLTPGESLGKACPICKAEWLTLRSGRRGIFAACPRYPDCKYTTDVTVDSEGNLIVQELPHIKDLGVCDKCGSVMVIRKGARGPFLACSGYPECRNTKSLKNFEKGADTEKTVKSPANRATKLVAKTSSNPKSAVVRKTAVKSEPTVKTKSVAKTKAKTVRSKTKK
jgi:DNA topoisomerase-1